MIIIRGCVSLMLKIFSCVYFVGKISFSKKRSGNIPFHCKIYHTDFFAVFNFTASLTYLTAID